MSAEDSTAHWKRATKALNSANTLTAVGEYDDAISRAYYAMMHAANALLATRGIHARSHRAVQRLISREFVRDGELARERARDLSDGEAQRGNAEYDVHSEATREDAEELCARATAFLTETRETLVSFGISEHDLTDMPQAPEVVSAARRRKA